MIEIFNISMIHEYEQGKSNHLSLVPFPDLKQFEFKSRLRFKSDVGSLRCYSEEDKSLLSEYDYFCFWLIYINTDLISYSAFGQNLLFDYPKFIWTDLEEGKANDKYILKADRLNEDSIIKFGLNKAAKPRNAIGVVAIKSEFVTDNLSFEVHFKTATTRWQYRIQADFELADWKFTIEDKKEELEFESELKSGELWFTSKTALPYFKYSNDRLSLRWEPKNDSFDFHNYKKQLPFPDFRYKESLDEKELSPVYIKL